VKKTAHVQSDELGDGIIGRHKCVLLAVSCARGHRLPRLETGRIQPCRWGPQIRTPNAEWAIHIFYNHVQMSCSGFISKMVMVDKCIYSFRQEKSLSLADLVHCTTKSATRHEHLIRAGRSSFFF
jgi:hypothetical protein